MATVADVVEPWLSGQNQIDALLGQFYHWQYHTPSDQAIYYTFSTTEGNQSDGFTITTNLTPFNAAQESAARQAIANAAEVTGIQFIEVANGELADIHFANAHITIPASAATSGSGSWSYSPDKILDSYDLEAWIYLDSDEHRDLFADPSPGTSGYQILLHELGHALTLKHPHEGDITLSPAEDNTANTVMSYNWVATPQAEFQEFDVAALQWWYGTDGLGGVSYGGTTTVVLNGTAGADVLNGGAGSDTLGGGAGNDTLIGNAGNDVLDGGAGIDSMNGGLGGDIYFVSAGDVVADAGGLDTVVADVSWTLGAGFEDLWLGPGTQALTGQGNSLPNLIWGNDGNNVLKGAGGNDEIHDYGQGNDTLAGGVGNDLLIAYYGDDVFLFEEAPGAANADRIFWFGVGADKIQLDAAPHANIGPAGALTSGDARFFAGPGASSGQDASDRVIYNTSTGELWYDADGSGAGAAQLIVRMEPIPSLAATDIVIVSAATPGASITGTSGNDSLAGTGSNDTINGLGGNDTLAGSAGTDFYDGGTGFDTLDLRATFTGLTVNLSAGTLSGGFNGTFVNIERVWAGDGNDSLTGTAAADSFSARGGNDTLAGAGGIDTLWGGTGADTFIFRETGTANADSIGDWTSGQDKLLLGGTVMAALGAAGNFAAGDARFKANSTGTATDADDRIVYNTTTRQVFYDADGSGAGANVLIATLQSGATLVATDIVVEGASEPPPGATEGNDSLVGTGGPDTINGLGGDDTIDGLAGNDMLDGGSGVDSLIGGTGNDLYIVDHEHDVVIEFENGGVDEVRSTVSHFLADWVDNLTLLGDSAFSGGGNDSDNLITGNALDNNLFGGFGNDTLVGGAGNDFVSAGRGNDRVDGGAGNDFIEGSNGADTLTGGDGDDDFWMMFDRAVDFTGFGNDVIDGGAGFDWLLFDTEGGGSQPAINLNLASGTVSSSEATATLANIEGVVGTDSADRITGNALANALDGHAHNDTLAGGGGNDTLTGGAEPTGLIGADTFFFAETGTANADQITDFTSGTDEIRLDGTVMTALGASGDFSAGDARFWSSSTGTAHDADDRVIYNTTTREIFYDADGSGSGAAQLIATLQSGATLAATDIAVQGGSTPPPGGTVINGTTGNDSLAGTGGNDTINGLGGNDTLAGSAGTDFYDGGTGFDTLDLRATLTGLTANLSAGTLSGGFNGTFVNIERVWGGDGSDSLTGTAGADSFSARGGNDTLAGAGGVDTLWGGGGADTFIFRETGTANADSIGDWASNSDTLALDNAVMTALGANGDFVASDARFAAGVGFTSGRDASDRVVFDTSGGRLYYDGDGSGAGAAQLIATVQSGATVAATDIVVI